MHNSNLIDNGGYAYHARTTEDSVRILNAANNWWGTTEATAIANMIYDNSDHPTYPVVAYMPYAGAPIPIDDTVATSVAESESITLPRELVLRQNYPNPFNAGTMIEFELARPTQIELSVYDLLGRKVRMLASRSYLAGQHQVYFDGCGSDGGALPSGVYFYRLQSQAATETRKLLLLK